MNRARAMSGGHGGVGRFALRVLGSFGVAACALVACSSADDDQTQTVERPSATAAAVAPSTTVATTSTTVATTSTTGVTTSLNTGSSLDPADTAPIATAPADEAPATSLVWGKDASPPDPGWRAPAVDGSYVDESYGTQIRRLTTAEGTRFNRNTYSRRNPENADGTMFFAYHGAAEYRVYRTADATLVRALDIHPDAEPQWHPTEPEVIRHIAGASGSAGDLRLYETEVATGLTTAIADLTDRIRQAFPNAHYLADRAEGAPSADGNRYAWIVHDQAERIVGLVSYDLASDRILGRTPVRSDLGRLDWVSITPSGAFVVMGYGEGAHLSPADFSSAEVRLTITGEHSDLAVGANGHDAYVFIDFSSGPNAGWLVAIDLASLEETRIFDLYDGANTSLHVSGKGYDRPGWVVVSTYNCKESGAWSCEKVMAVELQPNGRILNLAHTHNCGDDYWTETHAAVNRSFTRVYFNTDGGSCGIDAEVMEITVPAFG